MAVETEETALAPSAADASGENAQKTSSRPARQQLLLDLDMQRQAQDMNDTRRHDYFLSDPYPPSVKAVAELESIHISDLQINTHHRGKILVVRALDDGCRLAAVQTVVEDENGEAEKLAFYNTDAGLKAEEILPEDAIFAIKEPFYTTDAECGPCIRVDHPSDILRLSLANAKVPSTIRDALTTPESSQTIKSVLDWKTDGNTAYKAGDYRGAAEAYTQAVLACTPDDEGLKRDVLRNRSIVNTYLRRFESAQKDAIDAVIPDESDEKTAGLNAKAYFRAGRAAYELRHFDEAETFFKKVQELTPSDKDAVTELSRIAQRLKEQKTGDYDISAMSKSASEKHNRLDFADFTANAEIKETKNHGRGLFATKNLAAGDLVLCEKAFSVAFVSDREAARSYNILNRKAQRQSAGTQAILNFNLAQKLLYNPTLAAEFFDLSAGGYEEKMHLQEVDGRVPVDTFRINGIVDHNSLECPTVRSSSKAAQQQAARQGGFGSTGIWVRASYINHACDGKCMRAFIGDMIIIRASKDIAKGEELLMPYTLPNPRNDELQKQLQNSFGFKCDCPVCTAEQASTPEQRAERAEIIDKLHAIMQAQPMPLRQQQDRRLVAQFERLMTRLEGLYDDKQFERLPRIGLSARIWLCQAYLQNSAISRDKLIKTLKETLRDLGFFVTVEGQKVTVDRSHGLIGGTAIEAAMHLAIGYSKQGKASAPLAKQMEEVAKNMYLVMSGEMRGFEENFGKI